ncbi:cobyric acid synthase [Lichenicoccus sp.]|uniref:cobyric acid synthase n=1 Tax=Lichenicoccus sp. TaxID=2781899 RepID=UPI003D14CF20
MPALMIQGTGSSVGKSTIVAGLARALTRRGLRVLPFKPQNMSNNAAVTVDGGEIGRAQALQARACGVAPVTDMNPVLLKPQSQVGAQLVVRGRVRGNYRAREYQLLKPSLLPVVLDSFARLLAASDLVLVEGAGSASETNLRDGDIANMGFARATGTPVVLLGDIDRGGVIASLVGTRTVLDADDAACIKGFIVNRMRGDASLFDAGMRTIADHTGWLPLGLVPFLDAVRALPAEDAADLHTQSSPAEGLRIAVPMLPGIANFDDLDPLRAEPGVALVMVPPGKPLPAGCALVILPGSKATLADLALLRAEGWDIDLQAHHRQGGRILGLCGGYQMLGRHLADPDGIEGRPGSARGLGLLQVETVLTPHKRLSMVCGTTMAAGEPVQGYEMHLGVTQGADTDRPMLRLQDGRAEGATSPDGLVSGTYLHGLFHADAARRGFLHRLGVAVAPRDHDACVEAALDALAAHLEAHVDIEALLRIAQSRP